MKWTRVEVPDDKVTGGVSYMWKSEAGYYGYPKAGDMLFAGNPPYELSPDDFIEQQPDVENPPHYTKYEIEPKEYIMKNGLGWCEGSVIKYITRWRDKGGVDDLRKAKEFVQMLIDWEENIDS
jgi:hypothetical protein